MSDVPAAIKAAYDPERFRADGHRLIDALADQLAAWHAREGKAIPWHDPHEARTEWASQLHTNEAHAVVGGADLVADLARIAAASTALHHPRTMGHQVAPPLPGAALAELVSALINNGMAVAEMGPASTPIELSVIDWMCTKIGFSPGGAGVLTSGGSVGNLTALLAMRQAKAGYDAWSSGAHAGPPLGVIVSSDAHYSIDRALRVMGWGDGGAIRAEYDHRHRMTAASVEAAIAKAQGGTRSSSSRMSTGSEASGPVGARRVIGIVAAAGSTATGAFDPLDELADVAEKHGLWLHVDAAHGGSVALSETQRSKLKGIERADSVVWDLHKLMMMPALVTAVLFRQSGHAWEAFAQRASYLFADAKPSEKWWDLATRTLECTKRAMAIEMWTALRVHGESWFGAVVDRQRQLAIHLAQLVDAAPDFELALAPESNIVCFRHIPEGVPEDARETLDRHNRGLRERIVEDGTFYIVGTQLPGGFYLRSTLMNPMTEHDDLTALLDHIRTLAR
ncbi:MAG TPA: pyridoxal-dependent decarboxylase [Kofleriaceae bacterium]|jgi:L-2,4-diaminobutyrate decarboxylase